MIDMSAHLALIGSEISPNEFSQEFGNFSTATIEGSLISN